MALIRLTLTPRRLEANRANARRSTGPRTAAGKACSRFNALKHGRHSKIAARYFRRWWSAWVGEPAEGARRGAPALPVPFLYLSGSGRSSRAALLRFLTRVAMDPTPKTQGKDKAAQKRILF